MIGLGTVINVAGILVGGLFGRLFGRFLRERHQETLQKTCGIATLFIGIGGALEQMLRVENTALVSGHAMLIVLSLTLGALIGETLDLDGLLERFGDFLKRKTGSSRDPRFTEGFVTASLTVCIGAMAVIGALEDGLRGDYTILATKTVLDLIIVMVLSCTYGRGCVFSAIPVAVIQGSFTLLARLIRPLMTDAALAYLSLVGSILIFCVGLNLVFGKTVRVANLLPALVLAVAASYLPFFAA